MKGFDKLITLFQNLIFRCENFLPLFAFGRLKVPDRLLDSALINALRIPGQIIIHYRRAELQVHPLRRRFRGQHHSGMIPEIFNQCGAAVDGSRTGNASGFNVGFEPLVDDLPGFPAGVGTVEQDDLPGVTVRFQK